MERVLQKIHLDKRGAHIKGGRTVHVKPIGKQTLEEEEKVESLKLLKS
jgi:hypothetical protein